MLHPYLISSEDLLASLHIKAHLNDLRAIVHGKQRLSTDVNRVHRLCERNGIKYSETILSEFKNENSVPIRCSREAIESQESLIVVSD